MEKPISYDSAGTRAVLSARAYEELKQIVNQERRRVIQAINDEPLTRYYNLEVAKNGGYVCPICSSGRGNHQTGALKISSTNRVTCFSCESFGGATKNGVTTKGTDTLGAIQIIEKISVDEVLKKYANFSWLDRFRELKGKYLNNEPVCAAEIHLTDQKGQPITISEKKDRPKAEEPEVKADFSVNIRKSIDRLWRYDSALAYLRKRGLTDETIKKYRLGFDNGYIFIPYPNINSYAIKRAIFTDSSGQKYRKPSSRIAGKEPVFNAANFRKGKPVFIVEGPFDAFSIEQCGGLAIALVTTGTPTNFEKAVLEIREDERPTFILALDNDKPKEDGRRPGQDGQERLKSFLEGIQARFIEFPVSSTYKDANELLQANESQLRANIEEAIKRAEALTNGEQ